MDNIFKKLAAARVDLQNAGLTKSGMNNFLRFKYFELSDFLPEVNRLGVKYGFCTSFSINAERAELFIINTEDPSDRAFFYVEITDCLQSQRAFNSAVIDATLKMAEAHQYKDSKELKPLNREYIQELGKNLTYLRRYLLMLAFEICECDMIDASGIEADAAAAAPSPKKKSKQAAASKPAPAAAPKPEPAPAPKPASKPAPAAAPAAAAPAAAPEPFSKPILRKLWKDAIDFGYRNNEIEEIIERKASELSTEEDYSNAVKKLEYRLALDDFTQITEAELPAD